jgi:PAS domain S-box-containing protein
MATGMPRGIAGRRGRIGIVLAYALAGSAWIVFSDQALSALGDEAFRALSPIKGAGYVAVTAALVWLLMLLRDTRIDSQRVELAVSEERYRMLAERSQDVVYLVQLGDVPSIEYVSPAITALTGRTPDELYADPASVLALLGASGPDEIAEIAARGSTTDEPLAVQWTGVDGAILWTEHRFSVVTADDGTPVAIEGAARDVTARIHVHEQRAVLMRAIDAAPIGIMLVGDAGTGFQITYANRAACDLTGMTPAGLLGHSAFSFAPAGSVELTDSLARRLAAGETLEVEAPLEHPDGTSMPASILIAPILGAEGGIDGLLSFYSDRTEAEGRRRAEASMQAALDASPMAIVAVDAQGVVTAWNPAAEQLLGWTTEAAVGRVMPFEDDRGQDDDDFVAGEAGETPASTFATRPFRRADGTSVMCTIATGTIRDDAGRPAGRISLISDLTESLRRENWNTQLRRAIDHAAESVVITDLAGAIIYVNPAFEAVSGYSMEELLGRNPRVLKSGLTSPSVYEDMWRHISVGESWRGVLVNRRKDGSLYEEECTFSAVLAPDGTPTAYVGVKRDLTLERRLAAGLSSELLDRAAVEDAMAGIVIHPSAEETAQAFCDALVSFGEITDAWVACLPLGGNLVVPIATTTATLPIHAGEPLPARIATYIRERAQQGPWSDNYRDLIDPRIDKTGMEGAAVVGAPIRHRGRVVGVLFGAAQPSSPETWIARHLRVASELATHAGPTLGPQLDGYEPAGATAIEIRAVIDEARYTPVFQPICELATRRPVGWEALTRFDDGEPPLRRFIKARTCGLAEDLELACGRRAIASFTRLAHPGWLSLNVSPALVASGRAELLLAGVSTQVVLELTEQVPFDDYARVRGAVDLLDPQPMLAVGDAGAGYASLRHVLELRPDFVKLEPAFVRGIDLDAGRQAMVAGMIHYAAEHGTRIIAQGVETEPERLTLVRLGVELGQGFLLGVPSATGAVAPLRGQGAAPDRRLRSVGGKDDSIPAAG